MPVKKHRQHLKAYSNCFTSAEAIDWLHDLLRNNCNFGPEVTRQQTVQLLKKFLKNHVIEDVKGRWGMEDFEDNSQLYRYSGLTSLLWWCSIHLHYPGTWGMNTPWMKNQFITEHRAHTFTPLVTFLRSLQLPACLLACFWWVAKKHYIKYMWKWQNST